MDRGNRVWLTKFTVMNYCNRGWLVLFTPVYFCFLQRVIKFTGVNHVNRLRWSKFTAMNVKALPALQYLYMLRWKPSGNSAYGLTVPATTKLTGVIQHYLLPPPPLLRSPAAAVAHTLHRSPAFLSSRWSCAGACSATPSVRVRRPY